MEKNKGRKRDKLVNFRVSESELMKISKNIEKSKMKKEVYLRECALNKKIYVIEDFLNFRRELSRIGINVNQIALIANRNFQVREIEVLEYWRKGIDDIKGKMDILLQKVR